MADRQALTTRLAGTVMREASAGTPSFADLHALIDANTDELVRVLELLVTAGFLVRRDERYEVTEKGRTSTPGFLALQGLADRWLPMTPSPPRASLR